jgi:hypothetical protein
MEEAVVTFSSVKKIQRLNRGYGSKSCHSTTYFAAHNARAALLLGNPA